MTVSIIIAVKTWQKNLEECVAKCLQLDWPDFEIIVLPDNDSASSQAMQERCSGQGRTVPLREISTGPVSPAHKRDIALNYAAGEILAFIDDDAFPRKDWLRNAIENFQDPLVAAVGGPAITLPQDSIRERASGAVYESLLVTGKFSYRYLPKNKQEVQDYPSCNFLIRKSIMQELGGFKTSFWPGEDTKLCLDITQLNKKIIYDPQVLVYHHRRPLFLPHLKQIASYALHRGYFVKRFPETSRKFSYFIPTLFLFALLIGGVVSLLLPSLRIAYLAGLFLYLSSVIIFTVIGTVPFGDSPYIFLIPLVSAGIILTHLTYGFCFVKGLLSRRLSEDK